MEHLEKGPGEALGCKRAEHRRQIPSRTGNQYLPSPDSMDSSAQSVLVAPRGRAGILDGREHTGGYLEPAERIIC
jgi:hypothetical protein